MAFTSALLQKLGIDVKHEVMGEDGMASWTATYGYRQPSSIITKAPHLLKHEDFAVLHQVREPLAAIASIQTFGPMSWVFASNREPHIRDGDSLLLRAMTYWCYWNQMAEARARLTYQVEQLDPDNAFGLGMAVNARPHRSVSWHDLVAENTELTAQIRAISARYGYGATDN